MKILLEAGEEEEILFGNDQDIALKNFLDTFGDIVSRVEQLRYMAAVTGAMRWQESQEFPIRLEWRLSVR